MSEKTPRGLDRIWVSPRTARLRGGWLFDDRVRERLGLRDEHRRARASRSSDRVLWSLVVLPFVCAVALRPPIDPSSTWIRRLGTDAGAFVVGVAITWCSKALAGRERPSVTARRNAPHGTDGPSEVGYHPDHNASFLSGHALAAFTGASLSALHLLGAGEIRAGVLFAGASLTFAAATIAALLRIVADRHYATDTMAGALLGLLVGGLAPWGLAVHSARRGAVARMVGRHRFSRRAKSRCRRTARRRSRHALGGRLGPSTTRCLSGEAWDDQRSRPASA